MTSETSDDGGWDLPDKYLTTYRSGLQSSGASHAPKNVADVGKNAQDGSKQGAVRIVPFRSKQGVVLCPKYTFSRSKDDHLLITLCVSQCEFRIPPQQKYPIYTYLNKEALCLGARTGTPWSV